MLPSPPSYLLMTVDPSSSTGLGVAISEVSDKLTIRYATTINILHVMKYHDMPETRLAKMNTITQILVSMAQSWGVSDIASESAFMKSYVQAFKVLTQVIQAIDEAYGKCIPFGTLKMVDPKTVKTTLGIVGKAQKDKAFVKEALKLGREDLVIPPEILFDTLDQHAVDAIAIAYAFYRRGKSCP